MPPSIGKTPSLSRALRTPRTFLRFRVTPMVQAMGTTSEHRKGTQSWYRLTCCYSKLVAFMVLDCRNYKFGACKACRAMFSKGRGSTWGTNDSHWLKRIIGSPIVAYNVQNIAEFAHERAMLSHVEPPSRCRTGGIWQKETPPTIEARKKRQEHQGKHQAYYC